MKSNNPAKEAYKEVSDLLINRLWQCDGAGFVWLSCTKGSPAIQGHSSYTGTLPLYGDAPAVQVRSSWTGIRGRGGRRRQDGPSVHIDIHFFSGRQRTSSSISIFGQILTACRACDWNT